MARTRAADDFAMIRARMEELRRERAREAPAGKDPRGLAPQRERAFDAGLDSRGLAGGGRKERDGWLPGPSRR